MPQRQMRRPNSLQHARQKQSMTTRVIEFWKTSIHVKNKLLWAFLPMFIFLWMKHKHWGIGWRDSLWQRLNSPLVPWLAAISQPELLCTFHRCLWDSVLQVQPLQNSSLRRYGPHVSISRLDQPVCYHRTQWTLNDSDPDKWWGTFF